MNRKILTPLIVFAVIVFASFAAKAISKIDSLKTQIILANEDTAMVHLYLQLVDSYAPINADSSIVFVNKAIGLATEIDDPDLLAGVYLNVGNYLFRHGNYGRAIEYYYDVLKYRENNKDSSELIKPYFNIALVYDKLKDNKKSQKYYFKAVNIVEKRIKIDPENGIKYSIGRIYNNIGITFHNIGKYDKALDYYRKALAISSALNSKIALPYVYNNIGLVYESKGECKKALEYYQKSLDLRLAKNDLSGIALTYYYFGNCYSLMGEVQKTIDSYLKALDIARDNNFTELQKDIAEALIPSYAKMGDYKQSFEMHLVYKTLSDSLDIAESAKAAIMLEQQYKFDKVQQEQELQRQRILFRNITIGGVMFTLLIIFTMLFILAYNKVKRTELQRENLRLERDKLEDDLDFKNKELTTNVMYLLRKNELINSISLKLLGLKNVMLKANQEPIQTIINELQRSLDDDVWEEFECRFKDVHADFYKTLTERYPELTQNERKLCAFLRLNMSSKEISAITFQSVHSITVARSRMRKKLKLTNKDINLVDFLAGF